MVDRLPTQPKATLWDAVEYLDNEDEIAAYLEAALEIDDPVLIATARGDIDRARAKHASIGKSRRLITNDEGEVRELTAQDATHAVPFSALPKSEQKILLSLCKLDPTKQRKD